MARIDKDDILKIKHDCEMWLRAGLADRVTRALSELNFSKMQRSDRLVFAKFARRINKPKLGLKLTSSLVNNDNFSYLKDVQPEEMAEHGILLYQIGSLREGYQILESLSPKDHPDTLLYRSFCLFRKWEYASTIPLLSEYVSSSSINGYQRSIGEVNLLSALLSGGDDLVIAKAIERLEKDFRASGFNRLLANVLEMKTQFAIQNNRFDEAERSIDEAMQLLGSDKTSDILFIQKWFEVLRVMKSGDIKFLLEFRKVAESFQHWECVRDVDFQILKITKDPSLFEHLHFGTPHPAFRKRILSCGFAPPDTQSYALGFGENVLDLATGRIGSPEVVIFRRKILNLLKILFQDFYRPFQVGQLFSQLFPEEKFNINSSPFRVHQLIFRTRGLLDTNQLKLEIMGSQGVYRFKLNPGLKILITESHDNLESHEISILRLKDAFGANLFSAKEGQLRLGMSATSLLRVLRHGQLTGAIKKLGSSSNTRYLVLKENIVSLKKTA